MGTRWSGLLPGLLRGKGLDAGDRVLGGSVRRLEVLTLG